MVFIFDIINQLKTHKMKAKNADQFFRHVCDLQTMVGLSSYHEAYELYEKLHRLEARIHRENEEDCNGTNGLTEKQEERRDARRFKSFQSLLPNVPGLFVNGDPRGYSLKMHVKETEELRLKGIKLYTDWGRYGILAPEF
jgi:hypothetical protein